jgi:hypothetical protein
LNELTSHGDDSNHNINKEIEIPEKEHTEYEENNTIEPPKENSKSCQNFSSSDAMLVKFLKNVIFLN